MAYRWRVALRWAYLLVLMLCIHELLASYLYRIRIVDIPSLTIALLSPLHVSGLYYYSQPWHEIYIVPWFMFYCLVLIAPALVFLRCERPRPNTAIQVSTVGILIAMLLLSMACLVLQLVDLWVPLLYAPPPPTAWPTIHPGYEQFRLWVLPSTFGVLFIIGTTITLWLKNKSLSPDDVLKSILLLSILGALLVFLNYLTFRLTCYFWYDIDFFSGNVYAKTGYGVGHVLAIYVSIMAFGVFLVLLHQRPDLIKNLPPICSKCGYDLRGSPGPACSECGELIEPIDKSS